MTPEQQINQQAKAVALELRGALAEAMDRHLEQIERADTSSSFWLKVLAGVATAGLIAAVGLAWWQPQGGT